MYSPDSKLINLESIDEKNRFSDGLFVFAVTSYAKVDSAGKIMLGINADYGYTLTGTSEDTERVSEIGTVYGIGLKAGYGIFESGIIYTGLELQNREIVVSDIEWDGFEDQEYKMHFTQKYLEIPAAYRFLFWSMYADLGGFYSLRIGDMKFKETGYYSDSGTIPEKITNDDYGLLLGIGGLIPVGDSGGIDIGLKMKFGFAWVIDNGNTFQLQCSSLVLTVGYASFF